MTLPLQNICLSPILQGTIFVRSDQALSLIRRCSAQSKWMSTQARLHFERETAYSKANCKLRLTVLDFINYISIRSSQKDSSLGAMKWKEHQEDRVRKDSYLPGKNKHPVLSAILISSVSSQGLETTTMHFCFASAEDRE